MAEYVKRDSIIENILSLTVFESVESVQDYVYDNFTRKTNEWIGGIYDALVAVREVAVHDAEPVRHGRWEFDDESNTGIYALCSVCGESIYQCGTWYYCPNCGAIMDGGEDAGKKETD